MADIVKDSIGSYDGGSAHHLAISDMGNKHLEEHPDQNSVSLDVPNPVKVMEESHSVLRS